MFYRFRCLFRGLIISIKTRLRCRSLFVSPSATIGNNSVLKRGTIIEADTVIGEHAELYRNVVIGKGVNIGAYTSINDSTVIECGTIGNFCSIGVGVIIGLGEHPLTHITTSTLAVKQYDINITNHNKTTFNPPLIGHDVWIGSRALIMQGVKIGTGAVIGAGAVVTKDVPAYSIVAGIPAKFIRYRFDDPIRMFLLKQDIWQNYIANRDLIKQLLASGDGFMDVLSKSENNNE